MITKTEEGNIRDDNTPERPPVARVRYNQIDIIRGITLISMIAYHTVVDLVFIFGVSISWFGSVWSEIWQQSICWTFILLSGFCFSLGRKRIVRGLTVFIGGAIVSAVTFVVTPDLKIIFGILTLIGSLMIICAPLEKLLRKCCAPLGAVVSFLLFSLTYGLQKRYIGFFTVKLLTLPEGIYRNYFTAYLGFPQWNFVSADYFPIFPWIFLFVTGYFVFRILNERNLLGFLVGRRIPPLEFIGKHTLPIYMIHQPLIYGICWLIFK